jgi:hypothetical protein
MQLRANLGDMVSGVPIYPMAPAEEQLAGASRASCRVSKYCDPKAKISR